MTSEIKVDTISEQTSANGVTIDGLTIKDGNIIGDVALAGTTPTFTIGDGGAEDAALIFDGNALDFYIALDDSADDLVIGTGSTVGSNNLINIDSSGKIGLGTTSPDREIDIESSSTIGIRLTKTGGSQFDLQVAGNTSMGTLDSTSLVFLTNNTERARFDTSGNFGIGTTSIDVSTQAGGSGYRVLQIENDEGGQINLDHNDAGTGSTLGQINFQRAGEVVAEIEGVTDGATDNGKINFRTQPDGGALTVRMIIDHDGNVKITNDDNVYLSIDSTQTNGDEWHIFNAVSGSTSQLQFKNIDQSKVVMLLNETGNVLIGQTTAPASNAGLGIASTDSGDSASMYLDTYAANQSQSTFFIRASKNNTVGTKSETQSGQDLGSIYFQGVNSSSNFGYGANITASQTGSAGSSKIPTALVFGTSTDSALAERMRITGDGSVGIGSSSPSPSRLLVDSSSTNNVIAKFNHSGGTPEGVAFVFSAAAPDGTSAQFLECLDNSALRLKIQSDGDVQNHDNSYGSTSDERIKQDIRDSNSQWDDIKAVKVRNFKKKDDVRQYGDNAWEQIGVVAQELEAVSPKLIRQGDPTASDILSDSSFGTLWTADDPETQDAVDEVLYTADDQEVIDGAKNVGDVKFQSKSSTKQIGDVKEIKDQVKQVNYSILYMKAIKALQEAQTRIETLENKVAALEG